MKDELLYEQIIKEIRRKIESGEILPGDKTPSIAVIRREFHVSPVTAVRALKELTASGYLEKLPGRGYFAAERKDGRGKKNLCVGCLLRSNYVSLSDHYFNEIISGIQQAASLARVNLVWSYLSTHLCNLQTNLEQELVESALEMDEQVAGFLIDERVPDSAVREILAKTGKPAVMINRTTELRLENRLLMLENALGEPTPVQLVVDWGMDESALNLTAWIHHLIAAAAGQNVPTVLAQIPYNGSGSLRLLPPIGSERAVGRLSAILGHLASEWLPCFPAQQNVMKKDIEAAQKADRNLDVPEDATVFEPDILFDETFLREQRMEAVKAVWTDFDPLSTRMDRAGA